MRQNEKHSHWNHWNLVWTPTCNTWDMLRLRCGQPFWTRLFVWSSIGIEGSSG
jgi:hypothetical protein